MKIGIVGLGLIGGSMAKSIKEKTSHTVFGYDKNEETMFLAKRTKGRDAPLNKENLGECDMLMIAIRPDYAVQWVQEHAAEIGKGTIVVDLCGVKRAVVSEITPLARKYGFRYIGGHPMAGKEVAG